MHLRIMVSRHSAFYSPLIATIAGGFLEDAGITAEYSILGPGQRSHELIRDGEVDIMQSAVSSNWRPLENGISPLPVHFALINRRDGFFLSGRQQTDFVWRELEGRTLLADHGAQPLAMLRYAAHFNGVDWAKINVLDRGAPGDMLTAFVGGEGDYIHMQAPGPPALRFSVGASMPEVAFSTLCCSRELMATDVSQAFLPAYTAAREWVRTADPGRVAEKEAGFFPDVDQAALAAAIERYQALGTWSGSPEIARELYEQALNVFEYSGGVGRRHPFESVCALPPSIRPHQP